MSNPSTHAFCFHPSSICIDAERRLPDLDVRRKRTAVGDPQNVVCRNVASGLEICFCLYGRGVGLIECRLELTDPTTGAVSVHRIPLNVCAYNDGPMARERRRQERLHEAMQLELLMQLGRDIAAVEAMLPPVDMTGAGLFAATPVLPAVQAAARWQ